MLGVATWDSTPAQVEVASSAMYVHQELVYRRESSEMQWIMRHHVLGTFPEQSGD